jgi:hypothetical protein
MYVIFRRGRQKKESRGKRVKDITESISQRVGLPGRDWNWWGGVDHMGYVLDGKHAERKPNNW